MSASVIGSLLFFRELEKSVLYIFSTLLAALVAASIASF